MLDIAYTALTVLLVALTFGMIRLFDSLRPADRETGRNR